MYIYIYTYVSIVVVVVVVVVVLFFRKFLWRSVKLLPTVFSGWLRHEMSTTMRGATSMMQNAMQLQHSCFICIRHDTSSTPRGAKHTITTIFIVHYGNGWNVQCNMRSSSRTQNLRFAIVLGLTFTTVPENFWTSLNRRCTSPGQQNIHVLLQVRAIDERFDPELVLVDRPHDLCDEVARRQTEFIFATSCASNYTISSRGLCWASRPARLREW